ncbi:serine/threonine-protein kinase mTOR isoform X2 [Colias croceus]|uniref:serine/threonine-protein kinase mTOR isoform X1 n=1 Tax=Colias crocea TaxID=72248 RepID=UPI001E27E152|nr:serine/threonine-protein kinase mTOR isoform X1 [Colias croceus]XP_045500391.1 serine/threonine-protein kinase mTOR isoform X2 [Colias croceus]
MSNQVAAFVAGLKSRNVDVQTKTARELYHFAKTELREVPQEELTQFLDEFNHQIFEMVSSNDVHEKKGGVLAIVCLIGGDCDTTKTRITRFANYLRNLLPSSDAGVMELAAKTVGRLATVSGVKRAEYVEFEVKRAFEWLSEERNEGRRHSAVLLLKELAIAMPTYFYQQVSGFFDHILVALKDPKQQIREAAAKALRAGFVVTAQRETAKQSTAKPQWYMQCYEEAMLSFEDVPIKEKGITKEDRVHGGLLILNELLRCSNAIWEKKYSHLMRSIDTQKDIIVSDDIIFISTKLHSPSVKRGYLCDGFKTENVQYPVPIYESEVCKKLLSEKIERICHDVMAQRLLKLQGVPQILLVIIPRLAAFNKELFLKKYLNSTMHYLLTSIRSREKDKNMAFTTLGLMAAALEGDIRTFIPRIMDVIKQALPVRDSQTKKRIWVDPSIFACITLLSSAVKDLVVRDIKEILDAMFATGLSPSLTICMKELSENLPSLRAEISEGLLNMLSLVLRNKHFLHPGVPRSLEQQMSNITLAIEPQDTASIVLALRTLGTFHFEGQHSLLMFVRRCADHFLQSDQQEIRVEAVKTSAKLLADAAIRTMKTPSKTLTMLTAEVVGKMLIVSVTDPDYEVRYWVLESLTQIFDTHLAQIENLSFLFIAMNDEHLEIRELAICTIGRLSTVNPAYVMPGLRKTLIQFLTELEHSGMSRNKEQAARMLDNLILHAPKLVKPYMETILNVLVPKLKEPDVNPGVVISVLKAVGDLADVHGDNSGLRKCLPELLTILLDLLSDATATEKRSVALWAFGQLISATGYVVTPYTDYPNLMDVLLNFLKTEQQPKDRRETIRVLGLLGALDPYKHKLTKSRKDGQPNSSLVPVADSKAEENNFDITSSEMLVLMPTPVLDEYYPAIVISTLMRILRDPTLQQHHTSVVQAVTFIFQSLGIKCVPYISRVTPSLLYVARATDNIAFREFLFTQLAKLIAIVKQHIRNYLDKIFDLIKEFWTPNSPLQPTLILLVEHIAIALGSEFKVYLPQLMPQILRVLAHDTSKDRVVTEKLLYALQKFEDNLDDYMHLVIPSIVKLFDATDCPIPVAKVAMETVDYLSDSLNYSELVSRIIHPLVRSLDTCYALRTTAMDTLCALIVQLGRKFTDFIPLVQKVLVKHRIQHQNYELLLSKLQTTPMLTLEEFLQSTRRKPRNNNQEARIVACDTSQSIRKLYVNAQSLKVAWTVSSRVSKDDWLEWLRRFSIGLLTESHSPALRACLALAHNYSQLLRDLFNAAFVSCWTELDSRSRTELSNALEQALTAPDAPELAHTVLNLAEFMEHCEGGALPISTHLLGERAMHCRAYAKALHYKEEEFRNGATSQVVEALIHINNKLQQKEAAEGLLERVMTQREAGDTSLKVQIRWYEKLHNWEKALNLYGEKLSNETDNIDACLGELRCFEALGEWTKLYNTVSMWWPQMTDEEKFKAARLAAAASWGLNEWDSMSNYVNFLPENTQDGAFYRAVLNIHNGDYNVSKLYIDQARTLLDSELTAVAGESYQRAYGALVNAQLLAELEEVITYKLVQERRESIRQAWWTRLQGGQRLVEDWSKILQVRGLVLTPQEDMATWLKFASLCRKSGAPRQAHKTLVMLLGIDPSENRDKPLPSHEPRLTLAYAKHLWVAGDKQLAYDQLQRYVDNVDNGDAEHCRLLARCHLKLGSWCESLSGINRQSIKTILRNYSAATELSSDWYKAWHAWAYMNFETVLFYKHQEGDNPPTSVDVKASTEYIQMYTVPAVEGFFKSINLSHGSSLQDTLRLLTLWFDYGHHPAVHEALVEGIRTIEINVWLQVIPQLIARIDIPRALVGKLIHSLLIDIGKSHPQALVYPLTVASKSSFVDRKNAANQILKSMCTHSINLVNQAAMISEELIRVAILWHEQWHEALEEASRLYFSEHDVKAMFKTLEPLHAMLERGPQTLKEISFSTAYGRDLNEAQEWCNRFKESGQVRDLNQAWDLYYHVFRRISRQLPQLTSLELQYVSPRLLGCRDLELAVPGSYVPDRDLIRIAHIQSSLQVITSKQRPRRLCIRGSNGKDYMFLLKGHEDLRQDERVMQLFGLVNTLLQADPDTFRRDLAIQRYAVIPLSTNSGLIGWVPHCDTLHSLIRDYRDKRKILLNIEHRIMQRMASDLEKLMLMQKVEVFEHALEHTAGDDLAKLLWLKSPSSEVWFERRTNYTRSLAVMSMVGYILGLGDRHPSNIMLDRKTGKFLHIDFGDCFEVAVTRDKFPEKIPFRLTRMLINAMEVTGIEGTYRRTCESVMEVLHRHKDSVMAVLEAFVYDPLLNWRLIDAGRRSRNDADPSSAEGASPQPSRSRAALGFNETIDQPAETNLNKRALAIVNRVRDKLTGRDFPHIDDNCVSVQKQVDLLIQQATSNENLCQCYVGWCPFW